MLLLSVTPWCDLLLCVFLDSSILKINLWNWKLLGCYRFDFRWVYTQEPVREAQKYFLRLHKLDFHELEHFFLGLSFDAELYELLAKVTCLFILLVRYCFANE